MPSSLFTLPDAIIFDETAVNAAPQLLFSTLLGSLPSVSYGGARLVISGLTPQDRVTLLHEGEGTGQVGFTQDAPGVIRYGGVAIGTATGGAGDNLVVTFNDAAFPLEVVEVIRQLAYANTSDTPNATRTLTLDLLQASGERPNGGLPSFVEAGTLLTGGFAPAVAFLDMTRDGRADLLYANPGTPGLLRFVQNEAGGFNFVNDLDPDPLTLDGSALVREGSDFVLRNVPYKDPSFQGDIGSGGGVVPTSADVNGDGLAGLILGNPDGTLSFYLARIAQQGHLRFGETGEDGQNPGPFGGIDVGDFAAPAFTDLDGDGDPDLVLGNRDGTLGAWRNDGGSFAPLAGAANPFAGIDVGGFSVPTFLDLDGDGRQDLVVGSEDAGLFVFRNTGGGWAPLTGTDNPLAGLAGGQWLTPSAADIDGDGRIDLAVGKAVFGSAEVVWLRNTTGFETIEVTVAASDDAPVFISDPRGITGVPGFDTPIYNAQAIDPEGAAITYALGGTDAGLFTIGASTGVLRFADGTTPEFLGATYGVTVLATDGGLTTAQALTVTTPSFLPRATVRDFGGAITVAENAANEGFISLAPDASFSGTLLSGGVLRVSGLLAEDQVTVLPQGAGGPGLIGFDGTTVTYGGVAIASAGGGVGTDFTLTLTAAATQDGTTALLQRLAYGNVSDAPTATRTLTLSYTLPLDTMSRLTAPGAGAPNPLGGIAFDPVQIGFPSTAPALADLTGDGLLDLVMYSGTRLAVWRNTGTDFEELTGAANPLGGISLPEYQPGDPVGTPAFTDLDGDGRVDLVIGRGNEPTLAAYRNTGAGFEALAGTANPFSAIVLPPAASGEVQNNLSPAFVDLDNDGRQDLVIGTAAGTILGWRNTQDRFVPLTGSANPFAAIVLPTLGFAPERSFSPAFLDLDGDGRQDMVVGDQSSALRAFRNTPTGFTELTGEANPLAGLDLSALNPDIVSPSYFGPLGGTGARRAHVATGDVDRDGRPDLVASGAGGRPVFLRNEADSSSLTVTVTPQEDAPQITSPTAVTVGAVAGAIAYQATAADPDGPGGAAPAWSLSGEDAAQFTIDAAGAVRFASPPTWQPGGDNAYEVTITARTAGGPLLSFAETTGGANPFAKTGGAGYFEKPFAAISFADLDADGRLELVGRVKDAPPFPASQGVEFAGLYTHVWSFGPKGWIQLPDTAFTSVSISAGDLTGDLDNDGDSDLLTFADNLDGTWQVRTWLNTGTGLAEQTGAANPFAGIAIAATSLPSAALADVDGDGRLDLAVVDGYRPDTLFRPTGGDLRLFLNTAPLADERIVTITVAPPPLITTVPAGTAIAAQQAENISATLLVPEAMGGTGELAWSISGTDAGLFSVDSTTGALRFTTAPDFEAPSDAGQDNDYDLVLTVTDSLGASDSRAATITVTNVNEAPTGSVSFTVENGVLLAANTLADPDGLGAVAYRWQSSVNGTSWTDIAGATGASFMPGAAQAGLRIRVEAHYTDGGGFAESVTGAQQALIGTGSADFRTATPPVTALLGRGGNDTLTAGASAGSVTLDGGAGDDTLIANGAGCLLDGGGGGDTLLGGAGVDTLLGGAGLDTLLGGAGRDILIGGAGRDTLIGGVENDIFRYFSPAEGRDTILDFVSASDRFEISAAGFGGGLLAGAAAPFVANTSGAATSAPGVGQFVWETDVRTLWWDANGSGVGSRVAIAQLGGASGVVAGDIIVIA